MSSENQGGLDLVQPTFNPNHQSHHLPPKDLSYRQAPKNLQSSYQFSLLEKEGEDGLPSLFITRVKRTKTNRPRHQKRIVNMNDAPDLYHRFADMRPKKRESGRESSERENVGKEIEGKHAKLEIELHSLNVWSDNVREMKRGSKKGSELRDSGREMKKGDRSDDKRD